MIRCLSLSRPALVAASVLAAVPAFAQLDAAMCRGTVKDANGQPVPGVTVEFEYKGETRQKIVKTVQTDAKGGYMRVGLKGGKWTLTFRKEGFKTVAIDTNLSTGRDISEIPSVTLQPAPAAGAAGGAAGQAGGLPPGAMPPGVAHAKELGETYAKALAAIQAGDKPGAEALFKQILTEVPDLAEAHYNLGYLYLQRGAKAEAEAEFRRTIELQPQTSDSYVALGTLLDATQRGEDALKLLTEAAPRFEQDARFQFALGASAFNLGKSAEAEAAFTKAMALDPANAEPQFYLGSLALGRSDVPAAVDYLKKYVASARPGAANLETAKSILASLKK